MTLRALPVDSLERALEMGWVRNDCVRDDASFVNDNWHITLERQYQFWYDHVWVQPKFESAWIYITAIGRPAVGYSMLRRKDGKLWTTVAVVPTKQGLGIGKEIVQHYTSTAAEPLFTEILRTNIACIRAHFHAEWRLLTKEVKPSTIIMSSAK